MTSITLSVKRSLPNGAVLQLVCDVGGKDVYGATQKVQGVVTFASYLVLTLCVPS